MKPTHIKIWLGVLVLLDAAPVSNWLFPAMDDQSVSNAWWVYGVLRSLACLLWSKALADFLAGTKHEFWFDGWVALVWGDFIDRALFERTWFSAWDSLVYVVVVVLFIVKHKSKIKKWIQQLHTR